MSVKAIDEISYCREGDIIFADASEDVEDVGKSIEVVKLNNEKLLAGLHTFLARPIDSKLIVGFGGYLFKSDSIRNQIKRESQGAKVFGISKNRISNIKIYYPSNKKEQQKIASCLFSLDTLITNHSEKLDGLKDYKKWLMQNLFPQLGKLLPEIRFKEFKNDGDWGEYALSKITTAVFDGTHQTPIYVENGVPFFSVENIVSGNKNKFISKKDYELATSKNKPEKGDILLTRIGKIGFSAIVDWDFDFSIYVTLACIKPSKKVNADFLHYYFQSDSYQKEIFSKSLLNAVPCKINMNELRETKVLLPRNQDEQIKIAHTLSSLDDTISAQAERIKQLQLHKKGLMQQLFPKIN